MSEPSRVARTPKGQTATEEKSELFKVIVQALLIALVVRTFLFQPFNIPSGSLIPTLLIGDYIFVSKYSYGFSRFSLPFGEKLPLPAGRIFAAEPKRGDIAVFKLPSDTSFDYIKRVIGLPGDRIQMVGGVLTINGQTMKKELVGSRDTDAGAGYTGHTSYYRETLPNGVSYTIQEEDRFGGNLLGKNTDVYVVPPGNFFMMGDNRTNSLDSRVPAPQGVGYVPFENFVGRAEVIFFSVKEEYSFWQVWQWPWSVRRDRLFTPIR